MDQGGEEGERAGEQAVPSQGLERCPGDAHGSGPETALSIRRDLAP